VFAALIIKYHQQIWQTIQTVWGDIKNFITTTWNAIWAFAQQWWPLLLGPAGLIYKYHEQIWQEIQKVWNEVLAFLKSTWTAIENLATTVWTSIKNTAISDWDSIESTLKGIWNTMSSAATTAWNDMLSSVKNVWGTIVTFFEGVPSKVMAAVNELPGDMLGFGKDVLNQFLSGVQSVASSIVNFFTGLGHDIEGAFKDVLSIFSPSKVFYNLGVNLMEGIKGGIEGKTDSVIASAKAAASKIAGITSGGVSNTSAEAALQSAAAKMGWTGSQWTALYDVEMREAGFSLTAQNPSSGAYGMAQFINGPSEYAQYGGNSSTAAGQATAMVNYIAQRYGTPSAAWAHELQYGWYDQGGWLPTGASIAINNTGKPEQVLGPNAGMNVTLAIEGTSGNSDFDGFLLSWIRNHVRVKGGGNVQKAFGRT
jgi:hypothetical protein